MPQFLEQLRDWYTGLEPRQGSLFLGLVVVVALVLVGAAFWGSTAGYTTLHEGDFEDVIRGSAALTSAEIPFRIEGNAIQVPSDRLGEAMLAVRAADVVPSIEDAANLPMGMTPGQQKWAFLRAKEGDLARMINDFSAVASSRVSVVPREQQVFFGEETEATASVLVRLRPGAALDAGQVKAIVNLVATAVDGLSVNGVTLTDTQGNLLHGGEEEKPYGSVVDGELLAYQAAIEKSKEANVSAVLSRVFGSPGDFSVAAVAEVDLTVTEVSSTSYDPESQVPLEVQSEDMAQEGATPSSGVPGVDANTPERPAQAAGGTGSTSEKSRTKEKFAYSRRDERTSTLAPKLERLSIAVQINETRLAGLLGESPAQEDIDQLKQALEQSVRSAAGFDESRGDVVTVSFLPFAQLELVEEAASASVMATATNYLSYGLAALALVLVFAFVIRPMVAAVTAPAPVPISYDGEEGLMGGPINGGNMEGVDLATKLRAMVESFEPVDARDLNRLVEQEAESAADVIRGWNRAAGGKR